VLALVLFTAVPSSAQVTEAEVSRARELGYEGLRAFQRQDYGEAIVLLERAYRLAPVPTVGLWLARSQVNAGRLRDAAAQYLRVVESAATLGELEAQEKARMTAREEHAALVPRIPKLRFTVRAADPASVRVRVGQAEERSADGVVELDPGPYAVRARAGAREVEVEGTLAEGTEQEVLLDFTPREAAPRQPVPASQTSAPPPRAASGSKALRIGERVALGSAALGLVVGAGAATWMALERKAHAEDCEGRSCADEAWVARYNTLRPVSSAGFILAGAGAGAFAVLHWGPWARRGSKPRTAVGLGAGSLQLRGTF
jgi:hypothetical protein